jgi:SAM-dependent methyltransferase
MTAPVHHLYHSGSHYDRVFGGNGFAREPEVAFYRDLAAQVDDTILELACGTGRVAIPLARAGFKVAGIDVAEGMLAQAEVKAAEEDLDIQWSREDIRDFDLNRRFGLIFIPNNSICHVLTREDFANTIACVRKHLHPQGHFVIDVFVPAPDLLVDKGDERSPMGEYDAPDGSGHVVVTHSYHYESHTQIRRITTYHTYEDGHEVAGTLDMRMYFPQELDALLESNGLRIEHKYGNFDRRPFGEETGPQLVVCSLQETSVLD